MEKKAWVVAVDMGYGHQRAAYPLKDIAYEKVFTANSAKINTKKEKRLWEIATASYEWLSKLRSIPLIGKLLFSIVERFQYIPEFYPFRDISQPNISAILVDSLIKKGLCKSLIDYAGQKNLPFVATFPIPALAADKYGYKHVYLVATDTDISRAWVAKDPAKSKIIYFAPTEQVVKRLREYGVHHSRIIYTGFPLPKENLGRNLEILKKDLGDRLVNLDPQKKYLSHYSPLIKFMLGKKFRKKSSHTLTITFAVGGAGAQAEIAAKLVKSLRDRIAANKIRVNISVGMHLEMLNYIKRIAEENSLTEHLGKNLNVIFDINRRDFFAKFNECLHTTDILWTKPSELSFYTALGLPIIICPPIGAQEVRNMQWLLDLGSGFQQEDPKYVDEWIDDWLNSGRLCEAAWEGFLEAKNKGIYEIEKELFKRH